MRPCGSRSKSSCWAARRQPYPANHVSARFAVVFALSSIGTNAGRLNALTTKIINVEEEADQVYDRGLKALFVASRESDAMNFIVGSQVYDHLEKIVDRFEDVANEISSLV